MFWFAIALLVATTIVSALLQKHPKDATPAGRGDFTVPTAEAGRPIPVCFGTVKLQGPNVTWWGDLVVAPVKKSSGGFLGIGAKSTTVGYKYYVGMMLALCHGPVDSLVAVLVGEKDTLETQAVVGAPEDYLNVTINQNSLFGGDDQEGGVVGTVQFYRGLQTQNSNAYLSAKLGLTAPAYRGLCYAVLNQVYIGTSQYLKNWAFIVQRCPNTLGVGSNMHVINPPPIWARKASVGNGALSGVAMWGTASTDTITLTATDATHFSVVGNLSGALGTATVGTQFFGGPVTLKINAGTIPFSVGDAFQVQTDMGKDANAACVVYELMTSTTFGLGIPTARFDTASFIACATTLFNEGFGVSFNMDSNVTADSIIGDLARTCDFALYTDPATALWTMKMIRADYTLGSLTEFTIDDMLAAPNFTRGSWSETINEAKIEFIDRSQNFTPQLVQAQESANYAVRGETATETFSYHAVSNGTIAQWIACREVKTHSYPLASFKLKLNRKAWSLRPGGVFKLTWRPPTGASFVGLAVRVIAIRYGDMANPSIEVDCCEDIFAVASTTFTIPAGTGWTDPVGLPNAVAAQAIMEVPYRFVGENRFLMVMGARGDSSSRTAEIWSSYGGSYSHGGDMTGFTPTGVLLSSYSRKTAAVDATGFTLAAGGIDLTGLISTDSTGMDMGTNLALFEDTGEIVSWTTVVVNGDGTVSIGGVLRGVMDTVPDTHSAGSRVWFFTEGSGTTLQVAYPLTGIGTILAKLLPKSPKGTLALGSAASMSKAPVSRALAPYPPGNVKVNGLDYASWPTTILGDAVLSWNHRNKFNGGQGGTLVHQDTAGSDTVETVSEVYYLAAYINGVQRWTYSTNGLGVATIPPGVKYLTGLSMKDTGTFVVSTAHNSLPEVGRGMNYAPERLFKVTSQAVTDFVGSPTTSGFSNGSGTAALFQNPYHSVMDSAGNLFVLDNGSAIRKVSPGGVVVTFVDFTTNGWSWLTTDAYGQPNSVVHAACMSSITIDGSDNLYVFSNWKGQIVKVTPGGVCSLVAGSGVGGSGTRIDGTGIAAQFSPDPVLAADAAGNLFVQEYWGNAFSSAGTMRYCTTGGVVTTLTQNSGECPGQICVIGSDVYIYGYFNRMGSAFFGVRKCTPAGVWTTLVSGYPAWLNVINQLAKDPGGFLAFCGTSGPNNDIVFGKIDAGGAFTVVYNSANNSGGYSAQRRITDDPDGSQPITFTITPQVGSLSGTTRTLSPFVMTGFGMTFGSYFGGVQA